ncbi:MAG: 50S ribosomal protein L19 [Phycisphaera sp.]|nr:50S ribosomal protein L19 [Phycisphaera sp.]
MSNATVEAVEKSQLKADLPVIEVGDSVDVSVKIVEGSKERIQVFSGVVIAMTGQGISRSITVRRIVSNEGVERIFPLHSPRVAGIEVKRHGHVRRSKLYYLRDRVGKKRRLRDRRRGLGSLETTETTTEQAAPATTAPAKAD